MQDDHATPTPTAAQRAVARLARLAIAMAAGAMVCLVAVQGWQVVARYVLNDSPSWTEPVTLLLLSTAMSLGAAAGVHARRHFAFALLADALPPAARHATALVQGLVVVAIGAMLAWWGGVLFLDGIDIKTAGAAMPESIDYLPIAIGGALMVVFALAQLLPGGGQAGGVASPAARGDG
jgi:TRAP-type C4-dicarboxylate transport system permease small subunit